MRFDTDRAHPSLDAATVEQLTNSILAIGIYIDHIAFISGDLPANDDLVRVCKRGIEESARHMRALCALIQDTVRLEQSYQPSPVAGARELVYETIGE
jgi:hypothetical protein